jgi:hypothetical protein
MRKLVFAVLVSWAFMILAVPGFAGPPASYDSVVVGKVIPPAMSRPCRMPLTKVAPFF